MSQTRRTARQELDAATPEAFFQSAVVDLARLTGWLVFHDLDSRRNEPGFPDLVLLRPGRLGVQGQLVFAELKTETGRATSAQEAWLAGLTTVPGITTRLWRPHDWPEIEQILRARREGA